MVQAKLAARTAELIASTWATLDPLALDETVADWMDLAIALIRRQRDVSALLAANYLTVVRTVELGEPFPPVLAPPAPVEQLVTSLRVTGPVSIKTAAAAGIDPGTAAVNALVRVSGVAVRNTLDGGRQTIVATARADPRASGWERIVSSSACEFCVMLAGRGAVYSADTVDFVSHDHCSCSSSPRYR